jgi:hypothetical protein
MMAKVCSSTSSVLEVRRIARLHRNVDGDDEIRAEVARALAGIGLTRPPSTYSRPLMFTGWNTPGTAAEARTAMPVLPLRKTPIRRS